MSKKISIILIAIIIIIAIIFIFQNNTTNENEKNTSIQNENTSYEEESEPVEDVEDSGILNPQDKIDIYDVDGNGTNYAFTYRDEDFTAIYTADNWKIINSYKITNIDDMDIICQVLLEIHPIHGSDMISFRTSEDMAYEWLQHNLAYEILPKGNYWRERAKDVDLDPADQNKTFYEIYEQRTGKKFNIIDVFED